MGETVRSTIYFNSRVYRALRVKAAESGETISNLVGEAVMESFKEDEIDLAAFEARRQEPKRPLRDVIRGLKRDGLI